MRTPRTGTWLVVGIVLLLAGSLLRLPAATAAAPAPSITGVASRSGPLAGGQQVTIRGFDLTGTTSVLFGSVRTTDVQVVSPTQLTVRTPAHGEGRVYVRAVRPGATSPQASVATYFFLPRPRTLALGRATTHEDLSASDVSCASASFCGAGGEHFIDSSGYFAGMVWNGTRWSAQRQLEETGFAVDGVDVSCVDSPAKLCMFGTTFGHVWRTNGSTWSVTDLKMTPETGGEQIPHISCATSTFCKAAAGDHVWTWNGTTWGTPEKVLGAGGRAPGSFIDLSCPTTAFCYGVLRGSPATAIRWQRAAWEPSRAILPTGSFFGITCSSAAYCLASGDFGSGLTYLAYTGLAWSPPQPGSAFQTGAQRPPLECLSPTSCVRSGTKYETYNGSARPLTDPRRDDSVSCWATYRCLVVRDEQSFLTSAGAR